MEYIKRYLEEVGRIAAELDAAAVERMVGHLVALRGRGGRLFLLGVGGGAANALHAAADFRATAGIEASSPAENVAWLTARINDGGWESSFADWLRERCLGADDAVLVFSVGGGSWEKQISTNIVAALRYAKESGATILGVVGRDGGFTATVADVCLIVPMAARDTVTAHTESFQAAIAHLLASHPRLRAREMKWESTT